MRLVFLCVLAAPLVSWAQDEAISAKCQVGSVEVRVELRDNGDGLGSRTVHVGKKGSPEVEVKYPEAAVRGLLAPPRGGKSACDKTVGVVLGDTLLVALSEAGHPANPFMIFFTYSVGGHQVGWKRREPNADRISPDFEKKAAFTGKDGFCGPTRLLGEAEVGVCNEDCGRTHGGTISLVSTALPFDVYRCFAVGGDSGVVSVDNDRTYKNAWPELKRIFPTRDAFETAFTFSGSDYGQVKWLKANLADGRVCAYPTEKEKQPEDLEAWVCSGGGKKSK